MNTATRNKRDAEADKVFGVTSEDDGTVSSESIRSLEMNLQFRTTFIKGFDAAYAIARKEAEVLVEGLKAALLCMEGIPFSEHHRTSYSNINIARQALKTYEQGQAED